MALRLYTGSRDIPKDVEKAAKFLALAREKATTDEEHREAEYYEILITRLKAKEEGRTHSHTHPIRQRGALLGFELTALRPRSARLYQGPVHLRQGAIPRHPGSSVPGREGESPLRKAHLFLVRRDRVNLAWSMPRLQASARLTSSWGRCTLMRSSPPSAQVLNTSTSATWLALPSTMPTATSNWPASTKREPSSTPRVTTSSTSTSPSQPKRDSSSLNRNWVSSTTKAIW